MLLAGLLAALTPASTTASAWRAVRRRTVDGWTPTSVVVAAISVAAWVGIAIPFSPLLAGIEAFALITEVVLVAAVAAWHPNSRPALMMAATGTGIAVAITTGALFPAATAIALSGIDIAWYARAGLDVHRSEQAEGVSVWTWLALAGSAAAWTIISGQADEIIVAVACAAQTIAAVTLTALTIRKHRSGSARAHTLSTS